MALLITIVILALLFDFINGFHDAANSIATIVSTKVLTPFQAVLWAALFNFVAFAIVKFVFGGDFNIANTVSKTVFQEFITLPIIFSGIVAAILWNLATWWLGIPSSSSHTLIGGFMGAALMATHNMHAIHWEGQKGVIVIALFIFLAPVVGMIMATIISVIVQHLAKKANPHRANRWFKRLQLVSSALFSIGHGMNDSQKVMGIITVALIAFNVAHPEVLPHWMQLTDFEQFKTTEKFDWIPIACFVAIALGTMSGGWKIVKTMGSRITKVTPFEGVVAETAGALTLYLTEILSIPVSTTHTITGAIIGVGATKRLSAVRWGVTKNLLVAWLLTIPVSALVAAGVYWIVGRFV
jgi:PiT family inorganic phosphate transporter